MSLEPRDFAFDLLVVGGGMAGAGVARDAALRGLSCLLVEKGDFASGTSSRTSRIVHGGLSYLERGEFRLVLEVMHERDVLVRMAPHLIRPLPIVMPVYRGDARSLWRIRWGLRLYDLANIGRRADDSDILTSREALGRFPFLRGEGLLGAALFQDHLLAFPERLVMENILSAREHGAFCLNYHEVLRIQDIPGGLQIEIRDVLDGTVHTGTARAVVNASGVWADKVSGLYRSGLSRKTLPARGTHLVVRSNLDRALCASSKRDGRLFFALPIDEGQVLLGLARSDQQGDLDDVFPSDPELEQLVEEFQHLVPDWRANRENLLWACTGLHPLACASGGSTPLRHYLLHQEGPDGRFVSAVGGNCSTYRKMAEEAVDAVCKLLRHPVPSSTDRVPFFGGGFKDTVVFRENLCEWSKGIPHLPREILDHLVTLYGRSCCDVIHLSLQRDEWREPVAPGYRDWKAQVVYAVRSEDAHHLDDVILRRLRMGMSPDRGLAGAAAVADIMADELGWDPATAAAELKAFRTLIAREKPFTDG